jgi:MFS family permease
LSYAGAWAPIVAGALFVAAFVWHALHTRVRPLLDLKLFRAPGFAAASASVLLVGASLFGAMLIIPLYLQVDRGLTTLQTGLLMAPQGIGAACVMPISGRLTDRIGGGPVVLFGMIVMTLGSVGLTHWGAHSSYWETSAILYVRGVGLGCCFMPAMAAAYTTITRPEIPRATTAMNVFQRVGGSIGTALLAVVLEHQIRSALPHAESVGGGTIQPLPEGARRQIAVPLSHAFQHTFWWAVVLTAVGVVPALVLAFVGRTGRALPPPPPGPDVPAPEREAALSR